MTKTIFLKNNFVDGRGFIKDILYDTEINHVTLIYSKKGSVRGNHYHKRTVQYTYVVDGNIKYFFKKIKSKNKPKKLLLKKNSFIRTNSNEIHAFKFLKNSQIIVFSSGLRGGKDYEKDTFRIKII
jgi:dTDP-4-dehydrorhamnose 3,5-epimerase-like enzyme